MSGRTSYRSGWGTSGYGEAGASYRKRALKGFHAQSGDAHDDIDANNYTMRQRSRMLYMAAPIATSAIRTNRTNVIGCGLKLKSRVNRDVLGLSQKQADEWEKKTEAEFELWASKKQACDATGVNDFYSMQQLIFISWLMSGDSFALTKHVEATKLCPYTLRLHILEADRISTPNSTGIGILEIEKQTDSGNTIYDGVEIDKNGRVVAYHVSNKHPGQLKTLKWQRIVAIGEMTELPNILHIMDTERPEQYRGVSYLAQVIEPILQLRRYTDSEITTAIVQSFFTAFVTTEGDPSNNPLGGTNPSDESGNDDENEYELGPGTINIMKAGESVSFANPSRPANGFDVFVRALCEQVGAALEVPADLLLKSFNSSYSASRAALLEAWKAFKMRREWFTSDFCKPVYEIWLSESIAIGRIKAPGFFDDPYVRSAWLQSDWVGPSQGQLDPVKEITAETLAIAQGITTREQATVKINGGSWDSNMEQLSIENELLRNASPTGNIDNTLITNIVTDQIKMAVKDSIKEEMQNAKQK